MNRIFKKRILIIGSMLYAGMMIFFLYRFGMNSGGEAAKFINDANSIINKQPLTNGVFSIFYISYSLIIAFFIKCSFSFVWLALLQIFFSYLAGLLLYRLILKKTGNEFISGCSFIIYLFCYPVQKWALFAYSESVHTSLTVIGLYFFFVMLDKFSVKTVLYFFSVALLILTTRPVGIIFLLACFLTLIMHFISLKKIRIATALTLSGVIILIVLFCSPFRYFINPDSLRRMEVICQVPTAGKELPYNEYNRTGIYGAYSVIKNEIGFRNFFKTGFLKLKSFFGLIRPYFSRKNNLFLCLYLLLYPFAMVGLFYKNKVFFPAIFFCICSILITSLGIFVTCDDWSDRFIAPLFPFIIVLVSCGLYIINKKRSTPLRPKSAK